MQNAVLSKHLDPVGPAAYRKAKWHHRGLQSVLPIGLIYHQWYPTPVSTIKLYKFWYPIAEVPGSEVEVKKTTNLETSIHGLNYFGNYSLRVAAHTAVGDGVRSAPIFCITDEDGEHLKKL